jgi:acyl carrier protein
MDELTPRIAEILRPYISVDAPSGRLDFDPLDLPLIVFDIEDAFGIQMRLEDLEELASVALIAGHIRMLIETRPAVRQPLVPVSTMGSSQSAWTLSGSSHRAHRLLEAA